MLITIKYIGPTNTKGTRIRVTWEHPSTGEVRKKFVPFDHAALNVSRSAVVSALSDSDALYEPLAYGDFTYLGTLPGTDVSAFDVPN